MPRSKRGLYRSVILLSALAVSLAGCGTSATKRLGTGTAGGAATGAAFGLIGGPIGVVIGGAIGGGIGALTASNTTPKQINLDNIGRTGPAPAASPGNYGATAPASNQPGLRNQINQYQAQPQSLAPNAPSSYDQNVQSQPLPPPNTQ